MIGSYRTRRWIIDSFADHQTYRDALEEELKEVFSSRQGFLYNVLRYHLGWTDERGNPEDNPTPLHFAASLALATCEALSGDFRAALPAAAGVERKSGTSEGAAARSGNRSLVYGARWGFPV